MKMHNFDDTPQIVFLGYAVEYMTTFSQRTLFGRWDAGTLLCNIRSSAPARATSRQVSSILSCRAHKIQLSQNTKASKYQERLSTDNSDARSLTRSHYTHASHDASTCQHMRQNAIQDVPQSRSAVSDTGHKALCPVSLAR